MSWVITGAPGTGDNLLYSQAGTPALDLRFASTKSLTDYVSNQNLVTHTRASTGTFVGSDGVIRTAVTNLLLRSEEFNTGWSGIGASVSADATASPVGTITADTLKEDSSNGLHEIFTGGSPAGNTYTLSIFVKNFSGSRYLNLSGSAGSGNYVSVRFSPSANDLSSTTVAGNFSNATASVATIGDGWFRVRLTFILAGATSVATQIGLSTVSSPTLGSFGIESYTGDNTSGIYLWGAQLEQSSSVGEYVPTTSVINSAPRFDHNPTTGESLGLLVEEQRANLNLQSESFNTTWTAGAVTVTANSVAAPDGLTTADTITADGTTAFHIISQAYTLSATSYAYSVFAKKNTEDIIVIRAFTAFGGQNATFNLTSGTVTAQNSSTATIQSFGNGWYRCTMVFTSLAATSSVGIYLNSQNSQALSTSLFLWGAQLEAGSFPTSYIPTTTAAVTRAADVASISGSNFSSWYRQDEGTFYGDAQTPFVVTGFPVIADGRVSSTDIVQIGFVTESLSVGYVKAANADQAVMYNTGLSGVRRRSVACGMAANNFAVSTNGGSLVTDSSGSMPTSIASIFIGSTNGSSASLNGTIRRITYWPRRLANSILQTITQ